MGAPLVAGLRQVKLKEVVRRNCTICRVLEVLTVTRPDMLNGINVIIRSDRRIMSQQLDSQLPVNKGSVIGIKYQHSETLTDFRKMG